MNFGSLRAIGLAKIGEENKGKEVLFVEDK
jgi:hypothetical protein